MRHLPWVWLLGTLLTGPAVTRAADPGPAGTWKLTVLVGEEPVIGLVRLELKDKKWQGKMIARGMSLEDRDVTVGDVTVAGTSLRFALKVRPQTWTIEGKIKDRQTILGNLEVPGRTETPVVIPIRLEATTLEALDPFTLAKETLTRHPDRPAVFDAVLVLAREAAARKVKPAQVKQWADQAFQRAAHYGPRWQRNLAQGLAQALVNQEGMAGVALDYARRNEKLLDRSAPAATQVRALELLVAALKKAGQASEARPYEARLDRLEVQVYQEYARKALPFKPDVFAGRKGKSTRVVLVELFTGAQCRPCVAADLAFDALGKTYKATEVVLLQYHLHIPQPDALTNADSESRRKYYIDDIEGTPSAFFCGKFDAAGGGEAGEAQEKYRDYRRVIDPLLEKPPLVALTVRAVGKGGRIEIAAETAGLEKPGENVRLRLALVERWVKYLGGNRLPYHHHVVRALPGGAAGFALTRKAGRQTVSVDLARVRQDLSTYLDDFAAKKKPFRDDQRPLALRHLGVVAFVQDDQTKEVLQAAQVPVTGEDGKTEPEKKGR
jgi:hypothetical protein